MKLYATVTSERASKGQGGNDYLRIALYAEDHETPVGHIIMDIQGNEWVLKWLPTRHGINRKIEGVFCSEIARGELKGKKEKGGCDKHHNLRQIDCEQCNPAN